MGISSESENDAPTYQVQSLGHCAARITHQRVHGKVIGVTSKGVFLVVESDQILFLSGESFQGPLTINLAERLDFRNHFKLGETCDLSPGQLIFQHCRFAIPSGTPIWWPAPVHFTMENWLEVLDRGTCLAADLVNTTQDGLFFSFLKAVIRLSEEDMPPQPLGEKDLWTHLPGGREGQPSDFTQHLLGLIGRGKGLTPSGDDFLVGFLLASHTLAPSPPSTSQDVLQNQIVETAQRKTTTLSANLIQCAAEGLADERLMDCLHWLMQGGTSLSQVKSGLQSYGSSSGVDSFAGMLAAILKMPGC